MGVHPNRRRHSSPAGAHVTNTAPPQSTHCAHSCCFAPKSTHDARCAPRVLICTQKQHNARCAPRALCSGPPPCPPVPPVLLYSLSHSSLPAVAALSAAARAVQAFDTHHPPFFLHSVLCFNIPSSLLALSHCVVPRIRQPLPLHRLHVGARQQHGAAAHVQHHLSPTRAIRRTG